MLSGDSGHDFEIFLIVESWVHALLENPDGGQEQQQAVARWPWKKQEGDWGAAVSWRLGGSEEFGDGRPAQAKVRL